MTDADIKKALECCGKGFGSCDGCPYDDDNVDCVTLKGETLMMKDTLDLINRLQEQIKKLENIERFATKTIEKQDAEIERLKAEAQMADGYEDALVKMTKSEAIKEFAEKVETALDERVSEKIRERNPHWYIAKRIARETAIEMTEGCENGRSC